jgi:hypothetical protein
MVVLGLTLAACADDDGVTVGDTGAAASSDGRAGPTDGDTVEGDIGGADDPVTTAETVVDDPVGPSSTVAGASTGTVRIQLAPIEGFFIEGFEVGLRFEHGDGTVIASTLWTDFVQATQATQIDDYYDAVLEQPVPVGSVVVRAQVTIGAGPPPSIPDVAGELPCRLDVEVGAGQVVDVEVVFDTGSGCLHVVGTPLPSTTTFPTTPTPTATGTSGQAGPLVVGAAYYVDVDLECQAFELDGTWVLDDGDVSSWQPPGERHEGGTFVVDSEDHGTFRGDAAGTKVATFRRLGDGEEPACAPIPR